MSLGKCFKLKDNYGLSPAFQPGKELLSGRDSHLLGETEFEEAAAVAAFGRFYGHWHCIPVPGVTLTGHSR